MFLQVQRKASQLLSSGYTPNRKLSQFSMLDDLNVNSLNCLEYEIDDLSQCSMSMNAQFTIHELIHGIIKETGRIVHEKYITSKLPSHSEIWAIELQDEILLINFFISDENDSLIEEDQEPLAVDIDHWRRFIGQVGNRQITEPQQQIESLRSTTIVFRETFRKSANQIETAKLVKMGSMDEHIVNDVEEENLRQAKMRQVSILQLKSQNDKQKMQEASEQVKQLKRLNVDSKSRYTFDYEGKLIVQKPPEMDKYPKTQQNIQEKRFLLEVKDIYPNQKQLVESIQTRKQVSNYQINNNVIPTARNQQSQFELISLQKGVVMKDGKQEKRNDRQEVFLNMDIHDRTTISSTLGNQKLDIKLTKTEYKAITQTSSANQSLTNRNTSYVNQSLPNYTTDRNHTQNESILSKTQQQQHSINSSQVAKLNGSISILSEQQIEDLLVDDKVIFKSLMQQQQQMERQREVPTPTIEFPQITEQVIKGKVTSLPKSLSCNGTLPKIIAKNPRQRVKKHAIMLLSS